MTAKIIHNPRLTVKPHVKIGPRLEHDIRRRIREIESHWPGARTRGDWNELARLRQLLQLMETKGGDDDAS